MAKQITRTLSMLSVAVFLSLAAFAVSANAQSSKHAVANVPFDFVVGNSTLASGRYRLDAVNGAGDTVKISGSEKAVFRLTNTIQHFAPETQSKLVFHRYGDQYFLVEAWVAGRQTGRQFLKSSKEKAAENGLSLSLNKRFEVVEVALVQ